jgi:hypothetical protein
MNKCTVKLKDTHGTEHSATVYADSLYEAVIRGLNLLQQVGWESDKDETIKNVEVEVHHEPTRHKETGADKTLVPMLVHVD